MKLIAENELRSQDTSEFEALLDLFVELRPSRFIEIGCMYGWSLRHFIHYAPKGSKVLAIDLPVAEDDPRAATQKYNREQLWPLWAAEKNCVLHVIADVSQKNSSLEQADVFFGQESVDFLFIDGGHTYDEVQSDFEMYGQLVRPGGVVAFHDIAEASYPGTRRLWEEVRSQAEYVEFISGPTAGIGALFV